MMSRLTHPNYYTDCSVDDLDDTIELIQNEIDKFKEQNINKVILVSHLGHKADKFVAEILMEST